MDQDLKVYLDGKFAEVRTEMEAKFVDLRSEMEAIETRLLSEFWKWGTHGRAKSSPHGTK